MPQQSASSKRSFTVLLASALFLVLAAVGLLLATGLLDKRAPSVTLDEASMAYSVNEVLALRLTAEDASPGVARVTVKIDEQVPRPITGTDGSYQIELDVSGLPEGPHSVVIQAVDKSLLGNTHEQIVTAVVDHTPPTVLVAQRSRTATAGRTLAVFVKASEKVTMNATANDREARFYRIGDADGLHRALLGVPVRHPAGVMKVTIEATDRAGNQVRHDLVVQVTAVAAAPRGYVSLNKGQQADQQNTAKVDAANDKRAAAYAQIGDEQLWVGPFQRPTVGDVTSPFGQVRTYSSGVVRPHLGIDIANTKGTEVRAAAAGTVTLAEPLDIYGNAVIIQHGHGISSSYNHLAGIDVELGQTVQRGQRIGAMGSTGQSTGSHLHWGMVADGTAVDPMQWLQTAFEPNDLGSFE